MSAFPPQPPPEGLDLTETRQAMIVGVVVTLLVLATLAVVLRVCSRRLARLRLEWDDWLIFLALILAYGTGATTLVLTAYGLGKHVWAEGVDVKGILKTFLAYFFIYSSVVPATKMSIIVFYNRLFAVYSRLTVYALYICSFLVVSWWITCILLAAVQCRPYRHFWMQYLDPAAEGQCIDGWTYNVASGVCSVATDFLILLIPICLVPKLRLPVRQKLAVLSIFLLGGFVCVAGLVRLRFVSMYGQSVDISWIYIQGFTWSCVEPCIGIVSACLPTLRPLVSHFFPSCLSHRSAHTSSERRASRFVHNNAVIINNNQRQNQQEHDLFSSNLDSIQLTNDVGTPPRSASVTDHADNDSATKAPAR